MHRKPTLVTPLARARGLGSAKSGFSHWWAERISALALVPLTAWFIYSIVTMMPADREVVAAWVGSPFNAVALALFMPLVCYHTALGLRVVYEDYFHCNAVKISAIVGTNFAFAAMAVLSLFAIVKLHFGSAL